MAKENTLKEKKTTIHKYGSQRITKDTDMLFYDNSFIRSMNNSIGAITVSDCGVKEVYSSIVALHTSAKVGAATGSDTSANETTPVAPLSEGLDETEPTSTSSPDAHK